MQQTVNVLNQISKSLQARAKGHLQDIWMAETRADAEAAFDFFIEAYGANYDKSAERLVKDREHLLSFYDFQPNTGNTSAPPIPSRAPSPPCA